MATRTVELVVPEPRPVVLDPRHTAVVVVDTAANALANLSALGALTVPVTVHVQDSAAEVSALYSR